MSTFYTIGHSTRSVPELAALLHAAGADFVVDVRHIPRSRTNPQFNLDVLPPSLAPLGIGYRHLAALGGLRGRRKDRAPSTNTFWINTSFRNYADYAQTAPFRDGLAELLALGREHACAVMCAEAVWWRCHRRIIADYLLAAGHEVIHIMEGGRLVPALPTPAAVGQPDGTLRYVGEGA